MGNKRIPVTVRNLWHIHLLLDRWNLTGKNVRIILISSKRPYEIVNTVEWDTFESPIALLYIPCGAAWLFGYVVNNFFSK